MNNNHEYEQNATLFELVDDSSTNKKLNVVEADFIEVHSMSWETLFDGFNELYAITYSSNVDFIGRVIPKFRYAEIIFGSETVLEDNVAMVMSIQFSQLKYICKQKSASYLSQRMEEDTLKLFLSRELKSHEKIYILKSDDGKVRVITGSANLSFSAFNGLQRENITFMDNVTAFDHYYELFENFKNQCSDNVEHKSMLKMIANPDDANENLMDIIPISETIKNKNLLIVEESDNPEYIICADATMISKEIKPLMPKKDKIGKVIITPTELTKVKHKYRKGFETKQEERRKMPKLHIDVEHKLMFFNDKEIDLSPSKEAIKEDLLRFVEYMEGFDAFSGDVDKNRRTYFLFATWYLASPFMPYLRHIAYANGQDIKQFPVYAILYGESNGGKTEFINLLTKMMCGKKIPVNKSADFTSTTIDALKQSCEGLPIVIDDLNKGQYNNHISNVVKYDEWGIKEKLLYYPSVAITTNEIPSVKSDISKRAFVCHIDSCLDKEKARVNYKKITGCMNDMSNSFYCEYTRRMIERIQFVADQMKNSSDEYLPDIFLESSKIIIEIARELLEDNIPPYMVECEYNDYFGNKAVGKNAIQKIRRAWEFERSAFTVYKKKNILEYRIPESAGNYILDHIKQELPPSLEPQTTSRTLTMNLEEAKKFFDIDFKNKLFRK